MKKKDSNALLLAIAKLLENETCSKENIDRFLIFYKEALKIPNIRIPEDIVIVLMKFHEYQSSSNRPRGLSKPQEELYELAEYVFIMT